MFKSRMPALALLAAAAVALFSGARQRRRGTAG